MTGRVLRLLPVVLALALVGVGISLGFASPEPPRLPGVPTVASAAGAAAATVSGTWAPATPVPGSATVAHARGDVVHLFTSPDVADPEKPVLDNPTWEGLPLTFLVLEERGPWLHVSVSARPNGRTGWIQAEEVTLSEVHHRILIEVGRKLTLTRGDEVIMEEPVGVGADDSPTPLGSFFVDGLVDLRSWPLGPYGSYQISVSGFSERFLTFGGGVGQIAIHGTDNPASVGDNTTNGCLRMDNDAVVALAELALLGTPVEIVA